MEQGRSNLIGVSRASLSNSFDELEFSVTAGWKEPGTLPDGFDAPPTTGPLVKDRTFDCYGLESGSFGSPPGTPFEHRALPYEQSAVHLRQYKVIKDIPGVQFGKARPWFDQAGGGEQFKLPMTINELRAGKIHRGGQEVRLGESVAWLQANSVPEWLYTLEEPCGDEQYGIRRLGDRWIVFFCE